MIATLALAAIQALAGAPPARATPRSGARSSYQQLVQLFHDWRVFEQPRMQNGVPDYSAAAMRAQYAALAGYQRRLASVEPTDWVRRSRTLVEISSTGGCPPPSLSCGMPQRYLGKAPKA